MVRGKYDHDHSSAGNNDLAVDGDIKDTIADESKEGGEVNAFSGFGYSRLRDSREWKYCG